MKFRLKRLSKKRPQRVQIKIQDGQFEIIGMGAWYSYWRDPYHLLLTIPWAGFLLIICLSYIAINIIFALAYWLGGDCIANARTGSFLDLFFFSVQTLASIGYGAMYPKTLYSNIVVTIEAMIGLVGIAVMTGLAFARFSRPSARVIFSRVAVITPYNGLPTLMFRTANQRRNLILEAQMRVYLMRDEITTEGEFIRRFHDLKLLRNQTPSFTLSWLALHPIDETSPLYGMSAESLIQTNTNIVISVSGIDEAVAQVVHARHQYTAHDILWNNRFVDIFHHTSDGHRYIDYKYFHDVEPLDQVG
ncbi:K+ channel, inward rectifier [Nostoc sp. NIES-3756]|uniref:ion channel n=1 Tax=Nostoc sp. NIES-3756 TaxID=1751286 RepID=UPI0007223DF8|nr:ion channel [Nostoc sp. NIES-3756]BAT52630.1 K+ channel, inward rectifier [Nostoc sp. NIES-3756]BAY39679.1 K+ channel, inward rectifier [Nostoc sp. NIES-2111]